MNSIFVFSLNKRTDNFSPFPKQQIIGEYLLTTTNSTNLYFYESGENSVVILGICCNLKNNLEGNKLASYIVNNCNNIDAFLQQEYFLGGKYLIIYKDGDKYFMIGDASCSIPINYSVSDKIICTSNINIIVQYLNLNPDKELLNLRNNSDISQAMPYDITIYKEIKQLLPNYYLDLNIRKSYRINSNQVSSHNLSIKEATEITLPYILNLTTVYRKYFELICPITSGRDSRVVLAVLSSFGGKPQCYTIRHSNFKEDEQDLVIPQRLMSLLNYPYSQIKDKQIPNVYKDYVRENLGKYYSSRTLMIAYSVFSKFGNKAIINGDIIGQVGKSSLFRNTPLSLASARYFRCKLHNYHNKSIFFLQKWIDDVVRTNEKNNIFDLFSMENRIGRWAAQENIIYNLIGQVYLNVFNSRCIVYPWIYTSRKSRMKSLLHKSLIKKLNPQLLQIPFEKETSILAKISKSNGVLFYLSSFIKYYFIMLRFKLTKK